METIDRYSQSHNSIIENYPILTREEERGLANTLHKFKGGKLRQAARDKLFYSNIRLILNEVKKYKFNVEYKDMVSAGCEGLIIAIDRFNPRKFHTKLSTYAPHWIRLKINQFINTTINPVHIPSNVIEKSREYNKKDPTSISDKDLMKQLDISKNGLRNLRVSQVKSISMDMEINYSNNSEVDPDKTLKNILAEDEPSSDELYLAKDNKCNIMAAIKELTPIQQDVLTSRYLNGDKDNLKDIGKRMGLSGERVRQIEYKALKQMKKNLKRMFNFTK